MFDLIRTDRLLIRRFVPANWHAVATYTAIAEVMTYIPGGALTEMQARTFVAENAGDEPRALALIPAGDDRPIGHLIWHPWVASRTHEIGWVLAASHQGQGFATEAAIALLRFGFETLGLHRVIATCQPENVASWRVMEKLDMRREAHFQQCITRNDGTWWDEYFYTILAEERFARQAASM